MLEFAGRAEELAAVGRKVVLRTLDEFCPLSEDNGTDVMFADTPVEKEVVSETGVVFEWALGVEPVALPDTGDELVRTPDDTPLLVSVPVSDRSVVFVIITVVFVLKGGGRLIDVEKLTAVPLSVLVKGSDLVEVAFPLGMNVRLVDVLVGEPTVADAFTVAGTEVVKVVALPNEPMLELVWLLPGTVE